MKHSPTTLDSRDLGTSWHFFVKRKDAVCWRWFISYRLEHVTRFWYKFPGLIRRFSLCGQRAKPLLFFYIRFMTCAFESPFSPSRGLVDLMRVPLSCAFLFGALAYQFWVLTFFLRFSRVPWCSADVLPVSGFPYVALAFSASNKLITCIFFSLVKPRRWTSSTPALNAGCFSSFNFRKARLVF